MKSLFLLLLTMVVLATAAPARAGGGGAEQPPFRFLQTAGERLADFRLTARAVRLLPQPKPKDPILNACLPVGRYDLELDHHSLCVTGILRRAPRKPDGQP